MPCRHPLLYTSRRDTTKAHAEGTERSTYQVLIHPIHSLLRLLLRSGRVETRDPALETLLGDLGPAESKVEVKDDLESVPAPEVGKGSGSLLQAGDGLDCAARAELFLRGAFAVHGEHALQDFVAGKSETELGRGTQDTGGTTLEECLEALLLEYGLGAVAEGSVLCVTLAALDLQTGLDDVERCGEVGGGHTGDGTGGEQLNNSELLGGRLAEEVLLEMAVEGEVNGREGHVTQQARGGTLVKTDETKVTHDPKSRALGDLLALARSGLDGLTLNLQTNLDNLERVGEDDLATTSATTSHDLCPKRDVAGCLVGEFATNKVVDSKLDSLLRGNTNQLRQNTRVQTAETLVADDLLEAVDTVLVELLTDNGATLVLHAGLHQINGVHHEGTEGTSDRAEHEVVSGNKERLEERARGGHSLLRNISDDLIRTTAQTSSNCVPARVKDPSEVDHCKATRRLVKGGEVEENIDLHGCEQGETCDARSLVQEVGPGDPVVGGLGDSVLDDQLDKIHLPDDILESTDISIADPAARADVAKSRQVGQQVVGKLVRCGLLDDAAELIRLDVSISVLVEEEESLAHTLALQSAQHLCELWVGH